MGIFHIMSVSIVILLCKHLSNHIVFYTENWQVKLLRKYTSINLIFRSWQSCLEEMAFK